jgi:hypothetical protein
MDFSPTARASLSTSSRHQLWALKLRDPDFLSVFDLGDEVGSRFRPPGESIGMVEESRRRDWM